MDEWIFLAEAIEKQFFITAGRIVLRCDDKPVYGLLELLLPARAAFGFGVFLVVHALVLRRRDHRQPVFLAYLVTEFPKRKISMGRSLYVPSAEPS